MTATIDRDQPDTTTKTTGIEAVMSLGADNCGCWTCELYDKKGRFVRVRVEDKVEVDIQDLVDVLNDFAELACYGRHELSRIHLFRATSKSGKTFEFVMTYGQLFKLGEILGLKSKYRNLRRHCEQPISMRRRFSPRVLLHHEGYEAVIVKEDDATFNEVEWNGQSNGW